MPNAIELAAALDAHLAAAGFPDYTGALNGLQLASHGAVTRIASAVDFSSRTVEAVLASGADFLILHHGMFWGGAQRIVGPTYERLHALITRNVAVYSAHLPLDAHPEIGNNALLARTLGLTPTERFGEFQGAPIGIAGHDDVATVDLLNRAHAFAQAFGGSARASDIPRDRRTKHWAVITGAGGGSRELAQARECGIDTLVVGEGPHHVTVSAPEFGVVVIFAGHYATETLGVRALGEFASTRFDLPHEFLFLPTGS